MSALAEVMTHGFRYHGLHDTSTLHQTLMIHNWPKLPADIETLSPHST